MHFQTFQYRLHLNYLELERNYDQEFDLCPFKFLAQFYFTVIHACINYNMMIFLTHILGDFTSKLFICVCLRFL